MTLYEAPLEGGSATAVNLPDLDTSIGGVAVAAACDRSSVYLTSSTPDPTTPMQLYARTGTDWRLVEGDWKAGIVSRMVSAPNGVTIVSREIDLPGPDSLVARTVGADETSAERVSSDNAERAIVVDAASGNFVTVGPLPGLSLELESPANRPSGSVTTDELTP